MELTQYVREHEDGKGPEPTVKTADDGNGKKMKEFYLETNQ